MAVVTFASFYFGKEFHSDIQCFYRHRASRLFMSILWYFYIFTLPVFFYLEDNKPRQPFKPNFWDRKKIHKLIIIGKQNSDENQGIFDRIDTLDDDRLDEFYLTEIKSLIRRSGKFSKKIDLYLNSNLDLSDVHVDDISPYDFCDYYKTSTFYISNHSEKIEPFIEIDDVQGIFGIPASLLLPADVVGFMEEKKKVNKNISEWRLLVTPKFKRSLRKTSSKIQKRAFDCIEKILLKPMTSIQNTCMPLSGNKKGLWRYRFGDYRILYEPDHKNKILVFLDISSRSNIYD